MKESQLNLAESALSRLQLPNVTQKACLAILNDGRIKDIFNERNTGSVIAGAIYVAAIRTDSRVTQQQIADVMGLSESAIRTYYVKIAKLLGLYG